MHAIANTHQDAAVNLISPTATAGTLDMQNDKGYSALMCAADKGLCAVVERLVDVGAKPGVTGKGGMTALALACVSFVTNVPRTLVLSSKLDFEE